MTQFEKLKSNETLKDNLLEKLFNYPTIYRIKISLVRFFTKFLHIFVFRNSFDIGHEFAIRIPDNSSVFEIGCGDGFLFSIFKQNNVKMASYIGSDINKEMIDKCKSKFPETTWCLLKDLPYPFRDYNFDFVLICGVLHHLNDMRMVEELLKESVRLGKNVLMYEPLQSKSKALQKIKKIYWRITDGGKYYLTLREFHKLYGDTGVEVLEEKYTKPLHQLYFAHLKRKR